MGAANEAERAARLLLEAPAGGYDQIGYGPAVARQNIAAASKAPKAAKPRQRGRTGTVSTYNDALHPRVAKGRTGGGQFAASDKSAVQNFQRQQGLKADGIVGPKTTAAAAAAGVKIDHGGGRQKYGLGDRAQAQKEIDQAVAAANAKPKTGSKTGSRSGGSSSRSGSRSGSRGSSQTRRSGTTKGVGWQGQLGAGVIRRGDGMDRKGGDRLVKQTQAKLEAFGYDLGGPGVDGKFGPITTRAIKAFQRDHGLKADGVVGNRTKAMLNMLTHLEQVRTKGGLGIDQQKLSTTGTAAASAAAMTLG